MQITVWVADHHQGQNEEHDFEVSVSKITNHPRYNRNTLDNDFAILTLSQELPFSDKVRAVCLPDGSRSYYNVDAIVSGWGTTTEVQFIISNNC